MTANPEGVNPESKLQFHALQVALMLYGNSKKRADSMIFPLLKRYEEAKLSPSLESHGPKELKWRYNLWRRIN
ncbi:hypothetical protein BCR33DRAFT_722480 [Rhizoclosmatium globosum]|uniref:Uncharacterized protein n=1 Tax=Rhizoclosmatium globosum TaxID=329046 RepID=A0A1Y2BMM3_9FUNG|nr:hypothetical protein BCR33DRAFT_722480 [Rhizoclosmatium globosum]|eukprot:ORY36011.1 hypothetical protein BCR33DRAFT_722480 [Rhizoclosmatium globosum]